MTMTPLHYTIDIRGERDWKPNVLLDVTLAYPFCVANFRVVAS